MEITRNDIYKMVMEAIGGIERFVGVTEELDKLLDGTCRYIAIDDSSSVGIESGIKKLEVSCDGHSGDMVCIDHIEMINKGNNYGTMLMEVICKWADIHHIILTLTPSIDFGASSIGRLESFYKYFGFVANKGKNANFNTRQSMYRLPK